MKKQEQEGLLFADEVLNGEKYDLTETGFSPQMPQLAYSHKNGKLWAGDCVEWMKTLQTASVDLVFADPPYNIKKADWDDFN